MNMKKMLLACVVLLGLNPLWAEEPDSEENPIEFVTPDELADAIAAGAGLVVVDVRSEAAYKRGHIPGAISIPLSVIKTNQDIGLKPDDMIVLYCDCPRGGIALKAARILRDRGYHNLWVMLKGTRYYPGELEKVQENFSSW